MPVFSSRLNHLQRELAAVTGVHEASGQRVKLKKHPETTTTDMERFEQELAEAGIQDQFVNIPVLAAPPTRG